MLDLSWMDRRPTQWQIRLVRTRGGEVTHHPCVVLRVDDPKSPSKVGVMPITSNSSLGGHNPQHVVVFDPADGRAFGISSLDHLSYCYPSAFFVADWPDDFHQDGKRGQVHDKYADEFVPLIRRYLGVIQAAWNAR